MDQNCISNPIIALQTPSLNCIFINVSFNMSILFVAILCNSYNLFIVCSNFLKSCFRTRFQYIFQYNAPWNLINY